MNDKFFESLTKKESSTEEQLKDVFKEASFNKEEKVEEKISEETKQEKEEWMNSYINPKNMPTIDELMGKPKPKDDEAFVIIQDGGVGDAICATPLIESAKKTIPDKKIIVASTHHEVLIKNPYIDHLYNLAYPLDLFEKWVKPLRHFGSVLKRDIYNECAHKLFPGQLSKIWCYLYGLPWPGDNIKIYLEEGESKEAIDFLSSFPKPVVIIHTTGGRLTFDPKVQITDNKDWFLERWEKLTRFLSKRFEVVQVGGQFEKEIPGCACYLLGKTSLRQTAALLKHCKTFVSIDSFVGHCGPAVGKAGVVLFGRSNPYIAGHDMNINMFVEGSCEFNDLHCGRPQGYFGDSKLYRGQMKPWSCPTRSCMQAIEVEEVVESVMELIKEKRI